jgi:Protein of unknown function (DUF3500)
MKRTAITLFLLLQVPFFYAFRGPGPGNWQPQNRDMLSAANAFLQALPPAQRQTAVFPFDDAERFNWHFVPRNRRGLPLKQMDARQRQLAMALLKTGMSEQGFGKAQAIMELEVILRALEKRSPEDEYRHPEKYYFTIFGTPSGQEPWGWRVEGHHLAVNFSSVSGQVVAGTPGFMGANPGIVPEGPAKGRQILQQEANLGFALVQSFSPQQLKQALMAETAPGDIITGNSRKALLEKPAGIRYPDLTPGQQQLLDRLLAVYLNNYRPDLAQALRHKVEKAGRDKLYFAWAGHREPVAGQAHYYRIHSPVLLIEYDNSQNNANHVHTVVRDLTNDFGEDALKAHYQKHKH